MWIIFLKEFIKFRTIFWVYCAIICLDFVWINLNLKEILNYQSIKDLNYSVLYFRKFDVVFLDFINISFAISVAFMSIYREREKGRLRLFFNLPIGDLRLFLLLIFAPAFFIVIVFLSEFLAIYSLLKSKFLYEICFEISRFFVLNMIFALCAYFAICVISLQNSFKKILFYAIVFITQIYLYFIINPKLIDAKAFFLNVNLIYYEIIGIVFWIFVGFNSLKDYKQGRK